MCHAQDAVTRLISYIQQNGRDSEGNPVTTLKEADEIAAQIINKLVSDPIISQVVQEAVDNHHFLNLD